MNTLKQLEEKIIEEFDEYIPTYIEDFDVGRLEEFLLSALASQKEEMVKLIWEIREDTRNDGQIQYLSIYDDIISQLENK